MQTKHWEFIVNIKLLTVVVAVFLTAPALAQSAFQGFYGQISTGYESNTVNSAKLTGTDYGSPPNVSTSASPSSSSAPLVLGLGYTFSIKNNFTLGLGVDYSVLTQDTRDAGYSYPSIGGTNVYDYKFSISNRVNIFITPGYAINQNKLAYVKLGYSTQGVQYKQTNCCSSPSNTANVSGYVLGLGYKQMITDGLYGFAEANYYAYDKANLSSSYSDGPGGTVTSNPSLNAYNFLVGLGYKF
jgi:outer membrane immunogenic protein